MDKKKMKEKLHQYIDNLEDEKTLLKLHEAALEFEKAGKRESVDELTPKQMKQLDESIKQTDESDLPHEETVKRLAAWAFKLD